MWLDRESNPGPLAHESDALSTALRGPAVCMYVWWRGRNEARDGIDRILW